MKTQLCAIAILATLVMTACATRQSVPLVRTEFGDVPVLEGLSYRPGGSLIIETQNIRAARLLYRGRIEPGSLAVEMQKALEGNGWRLLRSTFVAGHGMTQIYGKGEASLQLRIWEGGLFKYYTYVDISGTRPAQSSPTPTASALTN